MAALGAHTVYALVMTWRRFGFGLVLVPLLRGLGFISFLALMAYATRSYRLLVRSDGPSVFIEETGFFDRHCEIRCADVCEIEIANAGVVIVMRDGGRRRIASGLPWDERELAASVLRSLIGLTEEDDAYLKDF